MKASYLLRRTLSVDPQALAIAILFLRTAAGLMVLYIHGWHKLEGGLAYLKNGAPWTLEKEVAGMHFPAPVLSAFAATILQLVCPIFLIAGCFTRCAAALLVGTLGVAILQNLLANRDPQLALLYVLCMATLLITGGYRYSVDAKLSQAHS